MAGSTRMFRGPGVLLFAATLVLVAIGTAAAHGGPSQNLRAEIDALPAALAGMRVEVHQTLAPQFAVENETGSTLEVLDARGAPFLRIGPHGVEGNLAVRAWYQASGPGAAIPPGLTPDGEPRWVRVRNEPSYGWFDPRLATTNVEVPPKVKEGGRAADVGRWVVPLRVDGVSATLAGQFRYQPPASGVYSSRMTSPPEIARGVWVRLLPGRMPGLLVQSTNPEPLLVLGEDGEPFLRIGPLGVEANRRSPTWRRSARNATAEAELPRDPSAAADWVRVSTTPRFGWIEPRLAYPESSPPTDVADADRRVDIHAWRVPMRVGVEAVDVSGVISWRKARAATRP